jgi:hypothetical protein
MKKYLFFMVVAIAMIGNQSLAMAQVQKGQNKKRLSTDQVIQKRTAQMVQTLMLDDKTTAQFTPVYSQYLKERMACRSNCKIKGNKKGITQGMTDEEAENIIKEKFAQSHKILDVQEKYNKQFHKILSSKQILRIYQNEQKTYQRLRQEMNRRKMCKKDSTQCKKQQCAQRQNSEQK